MMTPMFQAGTAEDYRQLDLWRNSIESSVLNIISIDPKISNFFVRNLIYAQTLKNNESDYLSVYEMLYEKSRPKEVSEHTNPIPAIENTGKKVL